MLYSEVPIDSLYRRMMHQSDNFLAEQILIMASATLSDSLSAERMIDRTIAGPLRTLTHKPRWVDGSGLSRYNLFTPSSFVYVLNELYKEIDKSRLFDLFPGGGESGTLQNWYAGGMTPYIFAKSGSLGNNYNLSGYLVARSGKVLIFSFMNNHFLTSTNTIRKKMQTVLETIRDNY